MLFLRRGILSVISPFLFKITKWFKYTTEVIHQNYLQVVLNLYRNADGLTKKDKTKQNKLKNAGQIGGPELYKMIELIRISRFSASKFAVFLES